MNLVIIDPNLAHPHGHHMEWDLSIANAAKERGQKVVIFANRECTIESQDGIEVVPWFTHTSYATRHDDAVTGQFDDFRYFNDAIAAELDLIPRARLNTGDLVLVPTLTEMHVFGYVSWAKTLDPLNAPLIVLYLMFPSGVALNGSEAGFELVDPFRALFYRLAFRASAEEGTPVHFFGGGRQLAREFSALFGTEIKPHPIPSNPARKPDRAREDGRLKALLFAGDAKVDKGFGLVPALADTLAGTYPDWTFVIHANAGAAWGPALDAYQTLLRVSERHPNIRLRTGRLTRDDYMSLLATSDCLVSTYDPLVYARKSSGVLWEAVSLGMVAVVPAGTWIENEAKEWGAGYRAYGEHAVPSICGAFAAMAADFAGLAALSVEAASRYQAFNGVEKVLNQLGALWMPRAVAVSLSKQPAAKVLPVADFDGRGWFEAEAVGETMVRWTDKEFVTTFDWPFRSAWELDFSIMNFIGAEQLRDAKAFVGATEVTGVPVVGDNGGSRLTVTAMGPGRAEPRVEVTVKLPWTYRPDGERRDLGLLVAGLNLRPAPGGDTEGDRSRKPLELLSPVSFNPEGTAFALVGAASGIAIVDPGLPVSLSFAIRSLHAAEVARRIEVYVNGVRIPVEAFAIEDGRWKAQARCSRDVVLLRGFQIEWDLVLHPPAAEPVWISGLTFDNETIASPALVRDNSEETTTIAAPALAPDAPEGLPPDAAPANARSFSKMLEERAAVRGSLSADRSGYVEAGVGTEMASAEALQLDGYFAGSTEWSHLEISLFLVSLQGESWSQVKFKFCVEQGRPLLEFRRLPGWPDVLETWFGTREDQFSPFIHVTADETFTDLRLTRRDFLLVQALVKLLPNVVERAVTLPEWRITNAAEWVKIAKVSSREWLTKIAAHHGASQANLEVRG